jgi:hypothetical protein
MDANAILPARIEGLHAVSHGAYGSPRIHQAFAAKWPLRRPQARRKADAWIWYVRPYPAQGPADDRLR